MSDLSDENQVWNRACMENGGATSGPGDSALTAALRFHSAAMSSGVLDALQRLQPDAIEAAAAGFRFFGLERQATFIISAAERARSEPESDEMEAELDRLHDEVGSDDEILLRKFQERFAEDRSAFASPT